jgi:enoyl-CoA hydratase
MSENPVLLSRVGDLAIVTINRPDKLNALNRETLTELRVAFGQAHDDDAVRVVVLTGAGPKAFVAGADINEFASASPVDALAFSRHGQQLMSAIERLGKPTIARINGFALGGGLELALACSLRIASETARLGLPEINLGILPGWGGTARLPRSMPVHRARELIFTGRIDYAADEMSRLGLLTRVFPYRELDERVGEIVTAICTQSLPSLRMAKTVIAHSVDGGLDAALAVERGAIMWLAAGDDARARIAGFAAGQG